MKIKRLLLATLCSVVMATSSLFVLITQAQDQPEVRMSPAEGSTHPSSAPPRTATRSQSASSAVRRQPEY